MHRRSFLQTAAAAPFFIRDLISAPPSGKLRLGAFGASNMAYVTLQQIARNPNVNLSFADAGSQKYVSVSGSAVISNDRAKIKQLFSTPAKAWWDSADDPNIRVLKITPEDAEFWDSPGTLTSYVKMTAAAFTGARPDLGDHHKVAL